MIDTLTLLRRVPSREWPAIAITAIVAGVVEAGLHTLKLPALARLLGVPLDLENVDPKTMTLDAAKQRVRLPSWGARRWSAVGRVMRHWPFGDTCLRTALVAGHRLRKLNPVLRVGVRKVDGEIKAHAWIEIGGASLDPSAPYVYSVMSSVGSSR
jgi:hypothetical protein